MQTITLGGDVRYTRKTDPPPAAGAARVQQSRAPRASHWLRYAYKGTCMVMRPRPPRRPRGPGLSTLRGKFTNYCCCIQNQSVRSIYMSIDRCARRDASSSSEVYRDVALVGSDTRVLPILGRWRLSPPRPRRDYYGVVLTTVYIQLLISTTTTYCTVSSSRPGRRWRCASRRRCTSLAVSVVGPEYE